MSEQTLKSLLGFLQDSMIAEAALSDNIFHPVDKGNNAEECMPISHRYIFLS